MRTDAVSAAFRAFARLLSRPRLSPPPGKHPLERRLDEGARRVMRTANREAQRLSHEYVGTEHVLLAILKDSSPSPGATLLRNLGVELPAVRAAVSRRSGPGPDMVTMGKLPRTPRVTKALAHAAEAAGPPDIPITTAHLVLGLMREHRSVAAGVLLELGVTPERAQAEVARLGDQSGPQTDS